jgi:predicted site-specific integrase-resolvase
MATSEKVEAVEVAGLLKTVDVARRYSVSIESVRNWANAGKLPVYLTPGGHKRFSPEAVEKFFTRA